MPNRRVCILLLFALVAIDSRTSVAKDFNSSAAQLEYFEKKVRPLLAEHCYSCHSVGAEKLQAGLRVDSRTALLQGGDSGAALVPGDANASLLIEAVRYESYEMPPERKLSDEDIDSLAQWVAMGAPWPDEDEPSAGATPQEFDLRNGCRSIGCGSQSASRKCRASNIPSGRATRSTILYFTP